MDIKEIEVKNIKAYAKNAKKHDERQIKNVMQSIKNYGIVQPLVVDKDNVLIIGHCRLIACKRLKMDKVPVVKMDELTQEQVDKLRLLDNKLNESEWDFDLLAEDVPTLDFSDFDIDWGLPEDIEENTEIEEDEAPEPPKEPKAKVGDLYILGNHRLICGDSTDVAVIDRLMDGVKADMVFTDPPYNMQMTGGCIGVCANMRKVEKDIESISSFDPKPFLEIIPAIFDKNMNTYIFCNKDLVVDYLNWGKENGYSYNILVWKKPNSIPVGDSHRPDLEYLLLFRKNAIWNNGLEGVNYSRCLEYSRVKKSDTTGNHPTVKPIELIGNEIKISSKVNSIVVDFFGGSGSTLIACEQLNRKCYMAELDPKYVSVIVNRWLNLTGRKDEIFCIRDGKKLTYDEVFN